MPDAQIIFDIFNKVPSVGLGQVESAQQVGVTDLRQQLIDMLMNPQEPQQAPEIRPAQRTLSSIGDALSAAAAALTRNPGLRTDFVQRLEQRRAFEQQRLDQRGQRDRAAQVQTLGLQLGAEQEELGRTTRARELASAREERFGERVRAEELEKEKSAQEVDDMVAIRGLEPMDTSTPEGRAAALAAVGDYDRAEKEAAKNEVRERHHAEAAQQVHDRVATMIAAMQEQLPNLKGKEKIAVVKRTIADIEFMLQNPNLHPDDRARIRAYLEARVMPELRESIAPSAAKPRRPRSSAGTRFYRTGPGVGTAAAVARDVASSQLPSEQPAYGAIRQLTGRGPGLGEALLHILSNPMGAFFPDSSGGGQREPAQPVAPAASTAPPTRSSAAVEAAITPSGPTSPPSPAPASEEQAQVDALIQLLAAEAEKRELKEKRRRDREAFRERQARGE
jgi:hypothetical protein